MDSTTAVQIAGEYEFYQWVYRRLADRVERFMIGKIELIKKNKEIQHPYVHLTQARAKEPRSLLRNLLENHYSEESLAGVTNFNDLAGKMNDFAGVRVIFHFRDDLEAFV